MTQNSDVTIPIDPSCRWHLKSMKEKFDCLSVHSRHFHLELTICPIQTSALHPRPIKTRNKRPFRGIMTIVKSTESTIRWNSLKTRRGAARDSNSPNLTMAAESSSVVPRAKFSRSSQCSIQKKVPRALDGILECSPYRNPGCRSDHSSEIEATLGCLVWSRMTSYTIRYVPKNLADLFLNR